MPMYAKTMMRYVFRRGAAMKEPNHVLVNEYEANAGDAALGRDATKKTRRF